MTQTKTCTTCGEAKPLTREHFSSNGRTKFRSCCKPCSAAIQTTRRADPTYRDRQNAGKRLRYAADPTHRRARQDHVHASRWGVGTYEALVEVQGEQCAICGAVRSGPRLNVDHCHATGRIRGLLCRPCNTAIGLMQDDIDRLIAAADYLRKS